MKKFEPEHILDQKRGVTHLWILIFCLILIVLTIRLSSEKITWDGVLAGWSVLFLQIELFLYIARLIFRDLDPGETPAEITRRMTGRLALYLSICLLVAFIITMGFMYIRQLLSGGDFSLVASNFFRYTFSGWLKSTLAGLGLGAAIFLVILWQDALRREQKLKEENLIFQCETLKNQVNPHFLFNCLNTLSSLIESQPATSVAFVGKLASIYRYILDNGSKDRVPLSAELAFIGDYFSLHQTRGEGKMFINIDVTGPDDLWIIPVSVQILIENAIKHNMSTRENPLRISLYLEGRYLVVSNNLQKMSVPFKSTRIGLRNLGERVRLVTGTDLLVEETNDHFTVKVPLLS